ncbi:MAG: LysM domain [Gemmatimonadetes bacterium]|nr:LysM domain [Gemmatimonadota bacterium]
MTDAPTPIPAEGVWTGDPADLPNWDAMPRRNRRRKRRGHYPIWLKYALSLVVLAMIVTSAQIAYHALRSDPRDAKVFADRELRLSLLRPNERVVRTAAVWQRPAIDYFRASKGLLALTEAPGDSVRPVGGRLIYLGLQPRDPLSPPDAPPTFDEREWPVDTSVELHARRTFFYLSPGLAITAPKEPRVTLGIATGASDDVTALRAVLDEKYKVLRAEGWRRREIKRARERAREVQMYEGRRPWYHTVRRGEALASVAKMFNTTPEALRALNGVVGDRIRIGQTLMVKPLTRQVVPFPPGVMPEYAPPPAAPSPAPTPAPAARAPARR